MSSRLRRLLPSGRFGRGIALIAGGTGLGQGIIVLSAPVLARLYDPKDFGLLAVYASLLGTLLAAASLRYELAIPLAADDSEASNTLAVAAGALLLVVGVVALAVFLVGDEVASLTEAPELRAYLWALPPGLLAGGAWSVLIFWGIRKSSFGRIGSSKVVQGVGQTGAQALAGVVAPSPAGLIIGDIVGRGSAALAIAGGLKRRGFSARDVSSGVMRAQVLQWRRFPLLAAPATVANSAGIHLTPLLVAATLGPTKAGWFAVGQRLTGLPGVLIGQAVAHVYMSEASEIARRGGGALPLLLRQIIKRLFLLGILPFGFVIAVGPQLFSFVLGLEWAPAGRFVQVLGLMYFAQFMVVPVSQTLMLAQRQDLQLAWDVSRVLVLLAVFGSSSFFGWSDLVTMGALCASSVVMYAVLGVLSLFAAGRVGSSIVTGPIAAPGWVGGETA